MKTWLACALVVLSGCPDVDVDPGETQGNLPAVDGPTVEFDPANSIIPFPNNLVINPATGKVTIPAPACETPAAKAVREGVLNQLDGFGTYEAAMQVTFTSEVDLTSLQGNVVMYERKNMGTDVNPSAATPVPLVFKQGAALRFDPANCQAAPAIVPAVNIIPAIPLDQKSTYTVAILDGIKTTDGKPFIPSPTWALVRQSTDPVTLADGCDYANPTSCTVIAEQTPFDPAVDADRAKIVGLDQLWKAEAAGLAFLDMTGHSDRSKVLVSWEVTTQTVTDQLDVSVASSPAAQLAAEMSGPLLGTSSIVTANNLQTARQVIEAFLIKAGIAQNQAAATAICNSLGCDAVGDVFGAGIGQNTFQTHVMNAYSGAADIPGPWTDPVNPAEQDPFRVPGTPAAGIIPAVAFIPSSPMPETGYPVVVFGHGLGSQKESLFLLASQLAQAGFASIAIDFVDHGARAVRVTADPALGCDGHCQVTTTTSCSHDSDCGNETCVLPSFGQTKTQCFAPFLGTDLAATRDNIRETILDLQRVVRAVKSCGTTACGGFKVDSTRVFYAGISLGGIIGTTTTATDADIKAAVLNVPGVGLVDILENSQTLEIKCPLVNGLIDAGIIQGTKWDPAMPQVGTCLTDDWKSQPGYQQFAGVARIVLDPADGANFTKMLATRRFLIQEVIGDKVVPNIATDNEGMLVGLMPQQADPMTSPNGAPSAAITTMPLTNKWLQYPTLPADPNTSFPGNTFAHGSLLVPANNNPDGQLGTARVQTDAVFYLLENK
jgi:alpha-beta hydrolase superfamily lysophospholipase